MQEADLLAAIAAAPDDDATRLVYADWLDEHGGEAEQAHAELIRCQVELARLDAADPRSPALLARSRRCGVLTAPRRPWVDHVPGTTVALARGLIAGARLSASEYLRHPPDRWRHLPLERLALHNPQGAGAALADRAELAGLRALVLEGRWPTMEMAPLLADCPHLAALRALTLDGIEEEAEGDWERLAERVRLPALEALDCYGEPHHLWGPLVPALAHPLRRLVLYSDTENGRNLEGLPDEWSWLLGTHHHPHLRVVWMMHHLNSTWGGHIRYTPQFTGLTEALPGLRLEEIRLAPSDLPRLLACPSWGPLRTLHLALSGVTNDLAALANAPQARQLEALVVAHYQGYEAEEGAPQPDALSAGPHLANLRRLRIGDLYSGVDAANLPALLAGPYREGLLHLELHGRLGTEGVAALAATPLPQLRWLTLDGVDQAEQLRPLYKTKNLPNLCTLVLPGLRQKIRPATLKKLASLPGCPHLSLLGACPDWQSRYWVLGDGRATPVAPEIEPLGEPPWVNR
jgi:uncharacterized protein (TIGR02996 family)